MKRIPIFLTAALFLAAAATLSPSPAQNERPQDLQVHIINKVRDGKARLDLRIDDNSLVIEGEDIALGETRFYTLEDGRELEVTREDSGLVMKLDGENIYLHGGHGESWIDSSGSHQVVELQAPNISDRVVITGLGDLDEEQRQAVREALAAAGVDKEVFFVQNGTGAGYWVDDANGVISIQSGQGSGTQSFHFVRQDGDTVVHPRSRRIIIEKSGGKDQ